MTVPSLPDGRHAIVGEPVAVREPLCVWLRRALAVARMGVRRVIFGQCAALRNQEAVTRQLAASHGKSRGRHSASFPYSRCQRSVCPRCRRGVGFRGSAAGLRDSAAVLRDSVSGVRGSAGGFGVGVRSMRLSSRHSCDLAAAWPPGRRKSGGRQPAPAPRNPRREQVGVLLPAGPSGWLGRHTSGRWCARSSRWSCR